VLEVLRDRSRPITERELAARLARDPAEDRTAQRLRCRLHHVDLPKLAAAGLLEWNRTAGTVEPTDHPAPHDDRLGGTTRDPDQLEPAVKTGASERRRTTLALLERQNGSKDSVVLASEVAICEHGGDVSSALVEAVDVALHHVHLPALEHRGVLEYDSDAGVVTPLK
jgi:hypothetical protein